MEKLSVEKRTAVSKMSTEHLRARLIKAGYDEDEVFEMDRVLAFTPDTRITREGGRWYECGGEVTAGVGVAERGTADAERDATTGRREKETGTRVPERETGEEGRAEAR